MTGQPLRLYISGPAFHPRPNNTDWQYLRMLDRLPDFCPELSIHRERLSLHSAAFALRYGSSALAARSHLSLPQWLLNSHDSRLPHADLRRSQADVVYAYGAYPINAAPWPVIFHTGAVNVDRMLRQGIPVTQIENLKHLLARLAAKCTLLTANSQAALDNLAEFLPGIHPKMRLLRFFLPHLKAASEASIQQKFQSPQLIKLIFIGREATRKGLPEVLAAFDELNSRYPHRLQLTVVSNFSSGPVNLPTLPNLHHHRSLDRPAGQQLIAESHFLLMPSHYESYGWVYLEAMAKGTVPLATDAPIQREILDNGHAGLLAAPDPARITAALTPLLLHPAAALEKALAAWNHCRTHFLPEVVARQFYQVADEAKQIAAPKSASAARQDLI